MRLSIQSGTLTILPDAEKNALQHLPTWNWSPHKDACSKHHACSKHCLEYGSEPKVTKVARPLIPDMLFVIGHCPESLIPLDFQLFQFPKKVVSPTILVKRQIQNHYERMI